MPPKPADLSDITASLAGGRRDNVDFNIPTGLTHHQIWILRILALCFSTFTLVSSAPVIYWFFRMRRRFRHDLILLLIGSDVVEALFFFIFPIVYFMRGQTDSEAPFCQVSGFVLSMGIEASDIAVALVAIHTALYVFRARKTSGSQSGLWPYRKVAYAVFFLVPILLASLAFINTPAYTNNGSYCYLPADSPWARIALSWAPRYFVLALILVLYSCIYVYVAFHIRGFRRQSPTVMGGSGVAAGEAGIHEHSDPAMPAIAYHGLIPSSSDSRPNSVADGNRQRRASESSSGSMDRNQGPRNTRNDDHDRVEEGPRSRQRSIARLTQWKWPTSAHPTVDPSKRRDGLAERQQGNTSTSPQHSVSQDPITPPQASRAPSHGSKRQSTKRAVLPPTPPHSDSREPSQAYSTQESGGPASQDDGPQQPSPVKSGFFRSRPSFRGGKPSTVPSPHDYQDYQYSNRHRHRRRRGQSSGIDPSDTSGAAGTDSRDGNSTALNVTTTMQTSSSSSDPRISSLPANATGMDKTRERIRRQLRLLFVYPLVYICVWALPFISTILKFDNPYGAGPFGFIAASLVSLCLQGAADSWVFAIREKPWRHARRSSAGCWGCDEETGDSRDREVEAGARPRMAERDRGADAAALHGPGSDGSWKSRLSNRIRSSAALSDGEWFPGAGGGASGSGSGGGSWWKWGGMGRRGRGGGRTREEMLLDGRVARTRRDIEEADRRARASTAGPGRNGEREWWDWLDNIEGGSEVRWDEEEEIELERELGHERRLSRPGRGEYGVGDWEPWR